MTGFGIAATWSLPGPAFALLRPLAALVTAVLGGMAVGKSEATTDTETCRTEYAASDETKSISSVKGVKRVDVNLSIGIATVEGEHNAEDIITAVRNAGFDVLS